MDNILGETLTATLGGKEYTLSPVKLKTMRKVFSEFKNSRIRDFVALAKETGLPPEIFGEEHARIRTDNELMSFEHFTERYSGNIEVVLNILFFTIKDFHTDLSRKDFDKFPFDEIEYAMSLMQPETQDDGDEKKKENLLKTTG